jgi:tRNA(Ile)-lysidine synthase TilS/MesJ
MDPGYNLINRQKIEENAKLLQVPITVFESDIFAASENANASSPCYLCARMRRGHLYSKAKELGCNKIALGHHLDDAAETFVMNLLLESRVGCFAPVTYLSRKDITMIRPLVYVREREATAAAERLSLPVVESGCPANEQTKREDVKLLLQDLSKQYGDVPGKIVGAMQRGKIDRWEK